MFTLFFYIVVLVILLVIFDWAGNKTLKVWAELRQGKQDMKVLEKELRDLDKA